MAPPFKGSHPPHPRHPFKPSSIIARRVAMNSTGRGCGRTYARQIGQRDDCREFEPTDRGQSRQLERRNGREPIWLRGRRLMTWPKGPEGLLLGGKGCVPEPTIPKWPRRSELPDATPPEGYLGASLRMVGPTHVPYRHVEPQS